MNLEKCIKKIRINPWYIFSSLAGHNLFKCLPDALYLKLMYRGMMGRKLDLKNPKTYNEKLQWLKLNDRNPLYTNMVDKYEVRKYIEKIIGEEHLIPLIGVWDNFEDIEFDKLPNQFVLKCTHDSGGIIICKDKKKFDIEKAKNKLNKHLETNFYYFGREWPYKNVKPRIICEKYMVDESGVELKDYKFFCFEGIPKALFIATDRGIDTRFDFFDMNFNHLPIKQHYKNGKKQIVKPKSFDKMVEFASKLSKDIPHLRVDFYDINGHIYFGELTFYHFCGYERFEPEDYDIYFGNMINLNLR
ncbi:hypothetical protein HMPREF1084_03375 [Clostridium butyricum 60E.3]|uniref:ATP-grasp fold amidoligase family protein n=1 Tax=Clostridium butyricum TaxID=1492 RepID=UPI0002D1E5C5|nr:ATP-grasp fold amidoligase family protein [Clostridium butyricum]ENZ30802.1 hypothetical protein HMPREF1084_03375 [Clostridium butyricum 60E.3]